MINAEPDLNKRHVMNLAAVQRESQHLTLFFSAPVNVPVTGAAGDSDNSDYHHEPGARARNQGTSPIILRHHRGGRIGLSRGHMHPYSTTR